MLMIIFFFWKTILAKDFDPDLFQIFNKKVEVVSESKVWNLFLLLPIFFLLFFLAANLIANFFIFFQFAKFFFANVSPPIFLSFL